MNILVDTSVWSLALRRKAETLNPSERRLVSELSELVREKRVRMMGLIRQELLSGIRTTEQFETLKVRLRAFPDELLDTFDYEEAARCSNECRAKGIVASIVDGLICAVAIKRSWSVFTTDPDFSNYAKVLSLEVHSPRLQ